MTTVPVRSAQRRAPGLFDADRRNAWGRYLDDTRDQPAMRYDEVEPWAWLRLQTELRSIAGREKALRG